jgi:hypothetical protein
MATLRVISFALLATSLLASSAFAQDVTKPLDLTVPPSRGFPLAVDTTTHASAAPAGATSAGTMSASAASTGTTPSTTAAGSTSPHAGVNTAPGVYYGDTSGAVADGATKNPDATTDGCDDATYNKPQVHGSVSTGVVAGNHFSGSYQTGTVNITQPLGDCKHPTGSLSISVSGGQSHFGYPRGGH